MARIAYVNGQYVPISQPHIHIEDRGYQFSDGIYEVCLVVDGNYWDEAGHLARMRRSLAELQIEFSTSDASLRAIMAELLRRNRIKEALVYIQITRGVAPRNHHFPANVPPVLVMTAKPYSLSANDRLAAKGVQVITTSDIRWHRVDIKSVSLLPNALAKQAAKQAGCFEAWLIRDGIVTEGSSSNAWIVDAAGAIITHPLGHDILGGITRQTVISVAEELQLKVVERAFTLDEALQAQEAFMTSATSLVMPITKIDGHAIGNAQSGPIALKLRDAYKQLSSLPI